LKNFLSIPIYLKVSDFIKNWILWKTYCTEYGYSDSSRHVSALIIVSGFGLHFLCGAYTQNSNRLWWMVGFCERLFDAFFKEDDEQILCLLNDSLADRETIVSLILILGPSWR
jgi:hypothetical protein